MERKNFEDVQKKMAMAIAFKTAYFNLLKDIDKKIINQFISFGTRKSISMLLNNIKNGVRRQTLSQTVLFYLTVLLTKKNR